MNAQPLYDLTPLAHIAALGIALATGPLAWLWLRHRHAEPAARLRALTLLTLFLTFDLVLVGAFTRLTDSGLGCPDWPGCYGSASPLGSAIGGVAGAGNTGPGAATPFPTTTLRTPASTGSGAAAANLPPVAGPIIAVFNAPQTSYTVQASDPEGKTLTYTWQKQQATPCGTFTATNTSSKGTAPKTSGSDGCTPKS